MNELIDVNLGQPPKEVKGHEQGFERPCIVIKAFSNLGLAIVIPVTSKQPKYSIFTIVKLLKGTGGLTSDSYALCHQISCCWNLAISNFPSLSKQCGK